MSFDSRTLTYQGNKIVYFVEGEQEKAVIYCHGDGQNHTTGKPYLALFTEFKKIAIDLPGHGYSSDIEGRNLRMEQELLATIIRKETQKPPILIGHSHGGALAASYASQQLVQSLVLMDPLLADPRIIFPAELLPTLEEKYLEMAQGKYDPSAPYHIYGRELKDEQIRLANFKHTPHATLDRNLNIYEGYDVRDQLQNINAPILILQSGQPSPFSTKDHVLSCTQANHIKVLIVEDGTHYMPIIQREKLLELIRSELYFLCV